MTAPRVLTETLVIRDLDGYHLPPGRYVWRGSKDQDVFRFTDSREIVCTDVTVDCETECAAVFHVERTSSPAHPSTLHQWRNVRINGHSRARSGFLVSGADRNGEHMRFDCVSVYGCWVGWQFLGQQAKEQLLTNCRFESGVTAIASDTGFQWIGGACAVCETGVLLTRVGDPVRISGVGFEACARLLETAGTSSDAQTIVLDSVRYAADQLHEDGAAIVLRHAGPLTIIGGSYGDGDQRVPQIHLAGVGEQTVSIIGAKFGAFDANLVHPVKANRGVGDVVTRLGCTYQTSSTSPSRTTTLNTAPVLRA